jgi:hypothetical protein
MGTVYDMVAGDALQLRRTPPAMFRDSGIIIEQLRWWFARMEVVDDGRDGHKMLMLL